MSRSWLPILCAAVLAALACVRQAAAGEHPGRSFIEKNGYAGPSTCEAAGCHPGTAGKFLSTVHWTHAGVPANVKGLDDPGKAYGMKNRAYTMCNGNELVSGLKEVTSAETGKKKFTGCDSCHPGDNINGAGSSGPGAEAAIDCLLCHASGYDFSLRRPSKDAQGRIVMGQDRSVAAALTVGRPGVKNCMACHESAGGGVLVKKGFAYNAGNDVHAARGMLCVDCHFAKEHRIPTGFDPNIWATDGVRTGCDDGKCHDGAPHEDRDLNAHTARIACQTCHIPRTGGAFAKDFTKWTKMSGGFWEPTTLRRDANESSPAYAWYNKTVRNSPKLIAPLGSRKDRRSRIYPFKIFEGRAFFDRRSGKLLVMDMGPPMVDGDVMAGLASSAKTLGLKSYDPVPGWQTIYFGSNHLVAPKEKALSCENCHARNGVLDFRELGYSAKETARLTGASLYFDRAAERLKEQW
ncbi:MAG TPA: hypothetical protein VIU29_10030 [Candidatus Deferrimicrobiaceae bacterium]